MEMKRRSIDWLAIDLVNQEQRKALKPLSIEERTKRALAKGEALLAQARLAHRLSERI